MKRSGMSRRRFLGAVGAGAAGLAGAAMMGSGVASAASPPQTPEEILDDLRNVYERVVERGYINIGIRNENNWATIYDPDDLFKGGPKDGKAKKGAQAIGGFDREMAMGFAAAVFGADPTVGPGASGLVTFVPITAAERTTALNDLTTDVNFRTITTRSDRDSENYVDANGDSWFLQFSPIYMYDGSEIWANTAVYDVANFPDGAVIAVQDFAFDDITAYMNAHYPGENWSIYSAIGTTGQSAAWRDQLGGTNCVYNDRGILLAMDLGPSPSVAIAETVAKEPLAAAVAAYDSAWHDILNWYIWGLFHLDEFPGDTASLDAQGPNLNLPSNWATSFATYFGGTGGYEQLWANTLKIDQGWDQLPPNTIAKKGGLQYAPKVPPV